jgi:hypothetical protein
MKVFADGRLHTNQAGELGYLRVTLAAGIIRHRTGADIE